MHATARNICLALLFLASVAAEGAPRNEAFLFIKPHALNEKVSTLVVEKIRSAGLSVVGQGRIGAETIARNSHIDHHYGVIANRAFNMHPSELVVQAKAQAAFRKGFGMEWQDALDQGLVSNCKDAMLSLDMDSDELDAEWTKLKKGVDLVKLGSGFYVGHVAGLYVINGFYLAMRKEYVAKGAAVNYFRVQFSNHTMPWASFRESLLGATDPAAAPAGSIRRAIYNNYAALDLPTLPHTGTNGVHASASPLEAMVERMNWLLADVTTDPFGKALLDAGVSIGSIHYWSKDPLVEFQGEKQSVFDLVEDLDFAECLKILVKLGGRDNACSCKSLVPCGFFAWRSVSDHTLASRKEQCSSQALVCAGHFEKAFKSVSDHSLAARRKECTDTSLVRCGHFANAPWRQTIVEPKKEQCVSNETALVPCGYFCNETTALVPCGYFDWKSISDHTLASRKQQCSSTALVQCGHFEGSFKSISEPTLQQRLAQCNETALICAGHFQRSFRSISEPTLKERLAQCNETALICAGHFERAHKSLSELTLQERLAKCNETALTCVGHFQRSFKSISEPTLQQRLVQCNETALTCAGHFEGSFKSISELTLKQRLAQCNETALICAGHFQRSFRSISEPTLKERLAQCNETALTCAGHFERTFRTLSDHTSAPHNLNSGDVSSTFKSIMSGEMLDNDEPCLTEECQERAINFMRGLLQMQTSGEDIVWGEDHEHGDLTDSLAEPRAVKIIANSSSSSSSSSTMEATDCITGRTSKTSSVSTAARQRQALKGVPLAHAASHDAK